MAEGTNTILVVDDEEDICKALEFLLKRKGYVVDVAHNGTDALEKLSKTVYDILLTDLRMEGMDGLELTRRAKSMDDELVVVIMTAFASIESAVEAMKVGAADYIVKPFVNDDVLNTLDRLLEHKRVVFENKVLRQQLDQHMGCSEFIGESAAVKHIFSQLEKIIPTSSNILLLGESGTGKGILAELIHCRSPRKEKPFMAINCSAIPDTLLESELFGYRKGAFTGADRDKTGLIRMADRGTLFLDEIGDMPHALQAKLLKVLESGELMPLGDTKTVRIDVRVIAATNKNLEEAIAEKTFREDLYYRLNVFEIRLPPLRERPEDIKTLSEHFIFAFAQEHHKKIEGITPEAETILARYSWPGNVRELRNVLERAVVLCDGTYIDGACLPTKLKLTGPSFNQGLKDALSAYERDVITGALDLNGWNKEKTASHLDIDLATLYRKMKKLGIEGTAAR